MSHYTENVKIKYKPKDEKVTVSIKLTEQTVITQTMSVQEFKIAAEQILNEIKEVTG